MAARPRIPIRKTYAFVGDGETELWYLQMLKKNEKRLTVTIKPELPLHNNPLSFVAYNPKRNPVTWRLSFIRNGSLS